MHQNIPQPMQQQQPRVFIPQSNQQIQQHQSTPVHQPPSQDQTPKKRTTIKITDPNSGKDLTNEFKERKKEKTPVAPRTSSDSIKTPTPQTENNEKAKANATFAAQVFALQQQNEVCFSFACYVDFCRLDEINDVTVT